MRERYGGNELPDLSKQGQQPSPADQASRVTRVVHQSREDPLGDGNKDDARRQNFVNMMNA